MAVLNAATSALVGVGGLGAFTLALLYIGRVIRADAAKRLDAYTSRLEGRVALLERKLARGERRRYQLEAILRSAGLPIPPWPDPDDDAEPGAVLIPTQRSVL